MVYKLYNTDDIATLPIVPDVALELLCFHTKVLEDNYGKDRNPIEDDGGYVLYLPYGTNIEELKEIFDISAHTPEWVNRYGDLCEATYLITNEFVVVIIMSIDDAPTEILNEID